MFPFGSAHSPGFLPAGRIAASIHSPLRRRTKTPPAEHSLFTAGLQHTGDPAAEGGCVARFPGYTLAWHSPIESAKHCHKVHLKGGIWMDLQPLGDRLIVEVLEEEETTTSGIVLPDTAKEKPQRGKILAVGPGSRNDEGQLIPMAVAEGDEIIFSKYGGPEVKLGHDDVLILRESDVLAKVVGTREPAGAAA